MRIITGTLLLILLGVNLMASPAGSGAIKGRVVDLLGDPIAGCAVLVRSGKDDVASTLTNGSGDFSIPNVSSGNVEVQFRMAGFKLETVRSSVSDLETRGITIGLEVGQVVSMPIHQVEGVVKGPTGLGLEKVSIILVSPFNDRIRYSAQTDKKGKFNIGTSVSGQFLVIIQKSGFVFDVRPLQIGPSSISRKIELNVLLAKD